MTRYRVFLRASFLTAIVFCALISVATASESVSRVDPLLSSKQFYRLGPIPGDVRSSAVTFWAAVLVPPMEDPSYFVRITMPLVKAYTPDYYAALVELNEIPRLCAAIDGLIGHALKSSSELVDYLEMWYETKQGVRVGYYQEGRQQTAFLRIAPDATLTMSIDGLEMIEVRIVRVEEMLLKLAGRPVRPQ